VHFTPEQGRPARTASHDGIDAADRGEFVNHEEIWTNIEKILRT
jgi:predicted transcriptional regulator